MREKARGVAGIMEIVTLVALTFSPIYLATFVIEWLTPSASRELAIGWVVAFSFLAPPLWVAVSELSSVPARILSATMLRGGKGSRYLGEVIGSALSVLYLTGLEFIYFAGFSSAFAAAALACLVYKAAEPVCYRLFQLSKSLLSSRMEEANHDSSNRPQCSWGDVRRALTCRVV